MDTKYIASYTRSHMRIARYSLHTTTSIHYYVTMRHDINFEYVLNHITQKIILKDFISTSVATYITKYLHITQRFPYLIPLIHCCMSITHWIFRVHS